MINVILLQTTHILQQLTHIFIKTYIYIIIFDIFDATIPPWDLRISAFSDYQLSVIRCVEGIRPNKLKKKKRTSRRPVIILVRDLLTIIRQSYNS